MIFQTDSPAVYFEKHYSENFNPDNYTDYVGEGRWGGTLGYFLGGYVPPGTPKWHPVLEKISPKIDTPF